LSDYLEISRLFEEKSDDDTFLQNTTVLSLKNSIENTLKNNTKQLIFIIGDPGVGKSAFFNHFSQMFSDSDIIKFDVPFIEPVDFIKSLIKKANKEIENFSLDQLIKEVVEIYKDSNYIILIDEAQLLSKDMIEVIRILADSKAFWFLLAMHKHESKKILEEPQFASRPHQVFELGKLQKHEYKDYLYIKLKNTHKLNIIEHISKKYLNLLYKLTDGNFRNLKKLLFTTFILLDYAIKNDKKKYQQINKCLLMMAAIDGGLIDA
jgi:replication-associated recombination protein RarA